MPATITPPLKLRRFGSISAGFPSPAQGYEDEPLDLNAELIRNPAATFFHRVEGDALRSQGILHGSVLVVDRSITPRTGQIVVADLQGERRVVQMPAFLDRGDGLQVWGTVVASITVMRR